MKVTSGETEGRRASRIDPEEGDRYLGIPQNPGQPPRQPVTINPGGPSSVAGRDRPPRL